MPLYRVLIHGSDFPIAVGDQVQATDFFATRWVEAANVELVDAAAVAAISEELQPLVQDGGDPRLYVEEVEIVESAPAGLDPGFSWFEHDCEEAGYDALDGEREAFWD